MFVRSCSHNYILRASTVRRLNTEDWATSANLSTRNSDQAKNLRTKLETRTTTSVHLHNHYIVISFLYNKNITFHIIPFTNKTCHNNIFKTELLINSVFMNPPRPMSALFYQFNPINPPLTHFQYPFQDKKLLSIITALLVAHRALVSQIMRPTIFILLLVLNSGILLELYYPFPQKSPSHAVFHFLLNI